jgi:hypothetical protein
MKRLIFWWVDDQPKRLPKSAQQRIEKPKSVRHARAEVRIKEVKNEKQITQLEAELRSAKSSQLPGLIMIDQILTNTSGMVRGSTLAVSLRAVRPGVPVVGVTAVDFETIAELQKDQFLEFFCLDDLQSGERIADLYAIADGFRQVVALRKFSKDRERLKKQVVKLIDCPTEDIDLLSQCLPGDLLGTWDAETPHTFTRWIWHTLAGQPGFLYDDLETATALGLTLSGLARVERQLRVCEYKGVLTSPARRRWWISRVRAQVRQRFHADVTQPLWKLGRQLLPAKSAKYLSRCHGRQREPDCVPDVVAFEDELCRDRVQVRSEDTQPLNTDNPPIGFEQRRVFFRR